MCQRELARGTGYKQKKSEGGWDRTIDHLLKRQMLYH